MTTKLHIISCFLLLILLGCSSQPPMSTYAAVPKDRPIGKYGDWSTNVESVHRKGLVPYSSVDSTGTLDAQIFAQPKATIVVTESKSKPYVVIDAEIDSKKDPLMRISGRNWSEGVFGVAVDGFVEFEFQLEGLSIRRVIPCIYGKGGGWSIPADQTNEIIHYLNQSDSVSVAFSLRFWGDSFDVTIDPIVFNTAGMTHFQTMKIPDGY